MAREEITVETMTRAGLAATYTAAIADGHKFKWSPDTFLHVKQGAGARVVTIQTSRMVDGLAVSDRTVNVAQNTERLIAPLSDDYIQSDGMIYIDYDATTNTTVALVRVPR